MTMSALLSVCVDSPWAEWRRELEAARCPWRSLKYLDLNGRLSCRVLQIIVAEVGGDTNTQCHLHRESVAVLGLVVAMKHLQDLPIF